MSSLPQSLAEWRGREGVGLEQLARMLRVEATTLERIEAGEVAPGNELRERIGKTIERGFDHGIAFDEFPCVPGSLPAPVARTEGAAPSPPVDVAASVTSSSTGPPGSFPVWGAGPVIHLAPGSTGSAARSPTANPTAPPVSFPAWGAWLARRDGVDQWQVELLPPSGQVESFPIEAARALHAKLGQLIAAHDAGPSGFATVFP